MAHKNNDILRATFRVLELLIPHLEKKQRIESFKAVSEQLLNKKDNVCKSALRVLQVLIPYLETEQHAESFKVVLKQLARKN